VILVFGRQRRPPELADDHAVLDACLLVQLAQETLLERFAWIETAGRGPASPRRDGPGGRRRAVPSRRHAPA